MNTVVKALQPPSRLLALNFRQSIRHYHPASAFTVVSSSHTLRSASSSLRKSTALSPTLTRPARTFSHGSLKMASEPQFAEGVDTTQLEKDLNAIQQQGWALDDDGTGVQKTYFFKTYFKAVSFVNVVASQSAATKHHPTMTVRIGSVDIHWTTHHPRGLTEKDISMAQHCEEAAELMGAVEPDQGKKCGPSRA
ncbi:transcriptional coactivator/pterin dehydratase [Aspergillus avenaceus]|uniref:4a-hydroxytetrahydrobiopterin dehydratase n=1 Tax=Aspergillus avenaceus TaxID=36643 RepID=A0A5N6TD27_ASPAV|nr:transcriptional coactivator/pterin dehydratase [Aspergillus avenaceus]